MRTVGRGTVKRLTSGRAGRRPGLRAGLVVGLAFGPGWSSAWPSGRAARGLAFGPGCRAAGVWPGRPGVLLVTSGLVRAHRPNGFGGAMNPLPAMSHPRSHMSRRRLLAGAGACLLAAGTTAAIAAAAFAATTGTAHAGAAADVQAAALGANWYESAPYYSTLDSSGPDLGQVMAATGQKAFEMAFILADGGCTPSWDGTDPVSVGHAGRVGHQRGAERRRRRDRLRGRLRRDQAGPGLRLGLGHRRRLPAGDHEVRAARDGLRPGGAGDRELVGDRQRARRRADPAAEQPRAVRLGDDTEHPHRGELLRRPAPGRGQEPGLHPERLLDHAVRRRLQRRLLAGDRAEGLQRAADEHVRLVQCARRTRTRASPA